jgi:hypothetical protein
VTACGGGGGAAAGCWVQGRRVCRASGITWHSSIAACVHQGPCPNQQAEGGDQDSRGAHLCGLPATQLLVAAVVIQSEMPDRSPPMPVHLPMQGQVISQGETGTAHLPLPHSRAERLLSCALHSLLAAKLPKPSSWKHPPRCPLAALWV